MKTKTFISLLAVSLVAMMIGCSTSQLPSSASSGNDGSVMAKGLLPEEPPMEPTIVSAPLVVKNKLQVGLIESWNDEEKLYIKVTPDAPWLATSAQLAVVETPADFPANPNGKLKPGAFPLEEVFNPAVDSYTFELDLVWPVGTELYVSLHARIRQLHKNGKLKDSKHAWSAGSGWPSKDFEKYYSDIVDETIIIIIKPPKK